MPRSARKKSESGIYHVVMRGVGRQLIFEDDFDCQTFLQIVRRCCDDLALTVYAWCLMTNHVHLLVKEGSEPLGDTMKRIGVSYAMRFNQRTGHVGHVFQDRYSSEPVDDDAYLLTVVRYIHNNPEAARVCHKDEYRWSSYGEYVGEPILCDTAFVLDMIGGAEQFGSFSAMRVESHCLDVENRRQMTDGEVLAEAKRLMGPNLQQALADISKQRRDEFLRKLRDAGASIRQAERVTGIGRKSIASAYSAGTESGSEVCPPVTKR